MAKKKGKLADLIGAAALVSGMSAQPTDARADAEAPAGPEAKRFDLTVFAAAVSGKDLSACEPRRGTET